MLEISIRSNVREIQRSLDALARKQLPFATAKALTGLAKQVQLGEQKAIGSIFDRPTPFTVKSVGVKGAQKNNLTALVFVKDVAASYLEPFEFGGNHKMIGGGRTWLNPKDGMPLNQYGNLTRNKLAQLKGRPDVFIGKVKTKNGETIDGVWQRPYIRDNQKLRGMSRARGQVSSRTNTTGRLKLLIRFGDPMPVKQRLGYRERAKQIIAARFQVEFARALDEALRSAKA